MNRGLTGGELGLGNREAEGTLQAGLARAKARV